jgi:hypothetical protein
LLLFNLLCVELV